MNKENVTMQKFMSKSEVRCASLMNNILDENIKINEILDKIKVFEQCNIRPGVGKIEFTIYVIDFIHNKTMQFVNVSDDNKPVVQNMFNVPEVESPIIKRIQPKTSTPKKNVATQDKKTVQIHTLTPKNQKTRLVDTTIKERKSLDLLGSLYAEIINSNVLCNLFHELGYIFTLLSVKNSENKNHNDCFNSNTIYFKSSDDCHYFASKTIQHLLSILVFLEKPIINLISKQKTVNMYVPEFTKTLECKLNSTNTNDDKSINSSITKDMVKIDEEHDSKNCFPTLKMFHAFKSQRDAFYDLLENWKQSENQLQLSPKKSAFILKIINENNGSVNMSKFAKLFVAQLVNSSFEESKNVYKNETIKELSASKLELLHRRITKRDYTSGHSVNPANDFPGVQMFFKKFTVMLLGNGIFCKHLIDTLAHRIDVINAMEWATELQEGAIYQKTFFFYVDSLRLLAKFLAFTLYHPYKDCNVLNPALKEYLWDVRSKVLPPLNLLDKLNTALKQGQSATVLTTTWIVEYLYQVDNISITTPFYKKILSWLYSLCTISSVTTGSALLLRLQFNCLVEFINITPHVLFVESVKCIDKNLVQNVFKESKSGPVVNTKQIYQYCPQLNNYRSILECKISNKKIKFISPTLSSSSQKANKNRLIELEIESHFFENHSPSVLVTVDFVAKRVASSCTKKIQNKGMSAVRNMFVDIVCEKFKQHTILKKSDGEFKIDESDIAKCNVFLSSTIQHYVDNFSKNNITSSIKELLDSDTVNPGSLPFCVAVTVRKFKALVTEWVKNHINIKSMFITYINTELKCNLKSGKINADGSNLRELMMPTICDEPDEDLFVPDNDLLIDLNALSLKIIETDDYQLTLKDIFNYAEKFKIILDNKSKMNSALYTFMVTRLIDNIFLATYMTPNLFNTEAMKAYHPYLAEKLFVVSKIICERNIHVLSEKSNSQKAIISEKITAWIQFFIENDFLTIDELTNQIMSILRISWPEDTLKCLSICFKDLNDVCLKKFDDTKVQELFLWLTHFMNVIEDFDVEF